MTATLARAPGKIILFGEHAVVYGRPAIAIPVNQVQAQVIAAAEPMAPSGQVWIDAPQINLSNRLSALPEDHPLALAIYGVMEALKLERLPAVRLRISSAIPIAGGMGSGAAVSVALIRALSGFLGHPLADEDVCALAYRVEKRLHGNPSGIDNTVVTYARPIYYQREAGFDRLNVGQILTFVIADSGVRSPTAEAVAGVRRRYEQDPTTYEAWFDEIGAITNQARSAIEGGPVEALGALMNANQTLLNQIGVSSTELDRLVSAALSAGAAGAKLSGGGCGGNMIALVSAAAAETVAGALRQAGATRTIIITLEESR